MKFWNGSNFITPAIFLVACVAAVAQSVTVELKNGDRITGAIVSEATNRLVLSNSWAREISLPLADIAKRTALTNAAVAMVSTNQSATNAVAFAKAVASTNTIFNSP